MRLKIIVTWILLWLATLNVDAAVVWVKVSINAQNKPVITPNPVRVATGDMLAFELTAINYECPPDGHPPKVQLHFPPNGPVVDGYHEIKLNRTVASRVNWPEGMTRYTYYVISRCSPGDPIPFVIEKGESEAACSRCFYEMIQTIALVIIALAMIAIAILLFRRKT